MVLQYPISIERVSEGFINCVYFPKLQTNSFTIYTIIYEYNIPMWKNQNYKRQFLSHKRKEHSLLPRLLMRLSFNGHV